MHSEYNLPNITYVDVKKNDDSLKNDKSSDTDSLKIYRYVFLSFSNKKLWILS